ncbi:hypothetical protein N7501_001986 [Penicillium viridicatum]|nr:hypothetical protein N7501_001986 [Penicillium viridicatum]
MPVHFPTKFDDEYWTTSKWLRVACIAASSPSPLYLVIVGASWGFFLLVNFLPLVWASIHLVLLRREVIFHPLFNASLDLLSIAVYLRIVIFLGPGLGEYVYKSITGPFMLAAIYCFGLSCLREVMRFRLSVRGYIQDGVILV